MTCAYYNEIDPYAAQWLRNLIAAGHIAPGEVDERSIKDVQPDDLRGFAQCHFFAGIGGWSLAARLAGWPDDRALWTGSCPCQPFSVAGKGEGEKDERHLWPQFFRLIDACRPPVVMGEQVAAAVGKHWLDGVCADLEGIGYAVGAAVVPACAVDAPHRRDRLWFVADRDNAKRRPEEPGRHIADRPAAGWVEGDGHASERGASSVGVASCELHDGSRNFWSAGWREHPDAGALVNADQSGESEGRQQRGGELGRAGGDPQGRAWIGGHDGKARRVEPGVRLLAHGVPNRVAKLRAFGNAIVPQVAAEFIGAYMDIHP